MAIGASNFMSNPTNRGDVSFKTNLEDIGKKMLNESDMPFNN
jgi:hypothetical protein